MRNSPDRPAKRRLIPAHDPTVGDGHVATLIHRMRNDTSALALRPQNPDLIPNLLADIGDFVAAGVPENTRRKETSAWKHYARACTLLGTQEMRADINFDGPDGAFLMQREVTFWTAVVILTWRWMKPRRRNHVTARVESALAVAMAARRVHTRNMHKVPPLSVIKGVLAGMKQKYIDLNGAEALLPQRKEPLTDDDTTSIIAAPDGTACAGHTVHWAAPLFTAWKAMLLSMRKAGWRKADALSKDELMHAMDLRRSHLFWQIDGVFYNLLTAELRSRMVVGRDKAMVKPAGSKSDPLAEFFGTQPIWLPWDPDDPLNAAASLAELELRVPVEGSQRADVALFCTADGPLTMDLADKIFAALAHIQLGESRAKQLSLHSPRVYLACALKALRCDDATIQALCRWKSPESIKIYGRLTPEDYAALIRKTSSVTTASVQATNVSGTVPQHDDDAFYASLDSEANTARLSGSDDAASAEIAVGDDDHIDEFAQPGDSLQDLAEPVDDNTLVCVPWTYAVADGTETRFCVGRVQKSMMSFRGQNSHYDERHYSVKFFDDSVYVAPASGVYFVDGAHADD